jgi:hypothetical protein
MEFPYRAAISYLTPQQKQAFEQFLAEEPEFETLYVNSKGEEREITRIDYPHGGVTKDSAFTTIKGEVHFMTPLASDNPTVVFAMVSWRSADGKQWKQCTSEEWFAWLGTDYKTKGIKPRALPDDVLRDRKIQAARVAMMIRKQNAEQEVERLTPKKEAAGATKTR